MNRRGFFKSFLLTSIAILFMNKKGCENVSRNKHIRLIKPRTHKRTCPRRFIESVDDLNNLIRQELEPGTIVYFREGTYKLNTWAGDGIAPIPWKGLPGKKIIIRPYKKEKVILDGFIIVKGSHQEWNGFECLNSRWTKRFYDAGESPGTIDGIYEAFNVDADFTTIRNCIIHDCSQGIRALPPGSNYLTVEKCRIYDNGWDAPDRGHGHGIYWNGNGLTLIKNWFGKGYSEWGIHIYGYNPSDNVICKNNKLENAMMGIYYPKNGIIINNQVKINIEDNRRFVEYRFGGEGKIIWDENTYIDHRSDDYDFTGGMTFEQWKEKHGFDLNSTYERV